MCGFHKTSQDIFLSKRDQYISLIMTIVKNIQFILDWIYDFIGNSLMPMGVELLTWILRFVFFRLSQQMKEEKDDELQANKKNVCVISFIYITLLSIVLLKYLSPSYSAVTSHTGHSIIKFSSQTLLLSYSLFFCFSFSEISFLMCMTRFWTQLFLLVKSSRNNKKREGVKSGRNCMLMHLMA